MYKQVNNTNKYTIHTYSKKTALKQNKQVETKYIRHTSSRSTVEKKYKKVRPIQVK